MFLRPIFLLLPKLIMVLFLIHHTRVGFLNRRRAGGWFFLHKRTNAFIKKSSSGKFKPSSGFFAANLDLALTFSGKIFRRINSRSLF